MASRSNTRVKAEFTWKGGEIQLRAHRAMARGTIGVGSAVVNFAQQYVDVISGDLRRSIHAARIHSLGTVLANPENVKDKVGALLEVGSWLDYACVEETGRMHKYMEPAIEQARGYAGHIMQNAFKQEGF